MPTQVPATAPVDPHDPAAFAAPGRATWSSLLESGLGNFLFADSTLSSEVAAAYEEYCRLLETGQEVDRAEFCRRYPGLEKSLDHVLSVHQLAESHSKRKAPGEFPQVGDVFAGILLKEELGEGRLGVVYLGQVPALGDRPVVAKVSAFAGFEARIQGPLEHPNIVPAHWVVRQPDGPLAAILMPYLGRATLEHLRRRLQADSKLPASATFITEAAQDPAVAATAPAALLENGTYFDGVFFLAEQVARALAYLHDHGIQHRDLKPSNVLVTPAGRALVMDFNLSADAEGVGLHGGTPLYMSPEQLRTLLAVNVPEATADLSALDERGDLYSFGVIVYELLTGRHPFVAPTAGCDEEWSQTLAERQLAGFRPLRELCPHGDAAILALVERCLAYDPDGRPASATEVADALAAYLKVRRQVLEPSPANARSRRRVAAAACLAACLMGLGFSAAHFLPAQPAPEPAQPASVSAYEEGVAAYEKRDYKEAVRWLGKALETDPDNSRALFARARAFQQWGESDAKYFFQAHNDYVESLKKSAATPRQRAYAKACLGYCKQRTQPGTSTKGVVDEIDLYYRQARELAGDENGKSPVPEVLNNLGFLQRHSAPEAASQSFSDALQRAEKEQRLLPTAAHGRALLALEKAVSLWPKRKDPAVSKKLLLVLQAGQQDIVAAAKGTPSGELYRDAALLFGFTPSPSVEVRKQAYAFLMQAVQYGIAHDTLTKGPPFSYLNQEFHDVPQFTGPAPSKSGLTLAHLLLDPLDGQIELPAE